MPTERESAEAFAIYVKQHRTAAKLKQTELADISGVPQPTISRIENAVVRYTTHDAPTVRRLALALGRPVLEAYAAAGIFDIPETEREALDLAFQVLKLDDEDRAKVRALIDELRRE